jgi:hypothetical protein
MAVIHINTSADWTSLSKADQDSIAKTLTDAGLMDPGDSIVQDPAFPLPIASATADATCVADCNAKQTKAIEACLKMPANKVVLCVIAAVAAGARCRVNC